MKRKKKNSLKLTAIILSICISITSVSPQVAEAGNFLTNFLGAIFTALTAPILLVAPDNPTLRKNNPFRKKVWEEQEEEEKKEKEREERYRKTCAPPQPATQDYENIITKLQAQLNGQQKEIDNLKNQNTEPRPPNKPPKTNRLKFMQEQLEELLKENLPEAVAAWISRNANLLQGKEGKQGPKGDKGEQGVAGPQGARGADGRDGETPTIDYKQLSQLVIDYITKNPEMFTIEKIVKDILKKLEEEEKRKPRPIGPAKPPV